MRTVALLLDDLESIDGCSVAYYVVEALRSLRGQEGQDRQLRSRVTGRSEAYSRISQPMAARKLVLPSHSSSLQQQQQQRPSLDIRKVLE